jgi:hypothetical protein
LSFGGRTFPWNENGNGNENENHTLYKCGKWFDFSSLQVQLTEERKKMKTQEKTDKVGGNICEI